MHRINIKRFLLTTKNKAQCVQQCDFSSVASLTSMLTKRLFFILYSFLLGSFKTESYSVYYLSK